MKAEVTKPGEGKREVVVKLGNMSKERGRGRTVVDRKGRKGMVLDMASNPDSFKVYRNLTLTACHR